MRRGAAHRRSPRYAGVVMAASVVELRALTKTFAATPVLREVSLSLRVGEAALITGGNGSGKSTLLRIVAGLSSATAGESRVFGGDSRHLDSITRARIGMLSHESWLYPNLTARENLEFHASIRGISDARAAADQWLDRVRLTPVANE